MASPAEKLAQSLEILSVIQRRGLVAIRSADLPRNHRERLTANGFLQEVIKGWYIPSMPDSPTGESTAWYASFWSFCEAYLHHRFNDDWCLSPEYSLALHAGNRTVPGQLLIRSPRARNRITDLPHGTSLFEVRASIPEHNEITPKGELRLFSISAALIACTPGFYRTNPTDARTALAMVHDASELLPQLLKGGHSTIAGRLVGAMRNIGRNRIAEEILQTMRTAGYDIRESDPFALKIPAILSPRETSPYVNRIRLLWQHMRGCVSKRFPNAPGRPENLAAYLKHIEKIYVTDAYHSLSIEGYKVTPALIERVRGGEWNPDAHDIDQGHRNALAARGYWQASQAVGKSIQRVLLGENPGSVADEDHSTWYRELFAPSVTAGLLRPTDLAGYRNDQIYIRGSMHVPPRQEAVRELMPALFDLLREEEDPSVGVVLGHFFFVYIHPYVDGNGRIGRFLMNLFLAAGGYPWTVVPIESRDTYMSALEEASVRLNIIPFTDFLANLVVQSMKGSPTAKSPEAF